MLQGIPYSKKFVLLLSVIVLLCPPAFLWAEEPKEEPAGEPGEEPREEPGEDQPDRPPAPGTPMPFQPQVPPPAPPAAEEVPQDNIPALEKPKPLPHAIDLVIKKGRVNKKTSSTGVQETYQFSVEIKNKEPVRILNEVQVNLYVLGRDVKDRSLYNLINHSLNVFTIAPQAVDALESSAFYLRYTKSSGTEFDGYLITIDDKDGHRLLTKSTNRRFENNIDLIRAAKVSKTKTNSFRLK